ncbi:MAG: TerB family tellurite resistance protein [Sandaracinaceae bacterium]|nr:TerB family tellurite resistance protein [Sandaracinaceae bacterium]
MTRPRDLIAILDDPSRAPLSSVDASAELLMHLIVTIFFADGHLDDSEVALFKKLCARDEKAVRAYVRELSQRTFDYGALASAFPDHQDRQDVITIAEHAIWGDDHVDDKELDVIDKLAEVLEITER